MRCREWPPAWRILALFWVRASCNRWWGGRSIFRGPIRRDCGYCSGLRRLDLSERCGFEKHIAGTLLDNHDSSVGPGGKSCSPNLIPLVPILYRYLPSKYVDAFVRRGEVLFRALSYFRDYEDAQVRGDEFEGTKLYRPNDGLEVTLVGTQEKRVLPHSFESAANEDDIFVFCMSTRYSVDLAAQFKVDACVEILNPSGFIAGVRAALLRRPSIKNKTLVHGEVTYYSVSDPPIVDWALPERIAMSKLNFYRTQNEYRIAFSVNNAFKTENTRLQLVAPGERRPQRASAHPERLLKLGSLSRICKIHRFE